MTDPDFQFMPSAEALRPLLEAARAIAPGVAIQVSMQLDSAETKFPLSPFFISLNHDYSTPESCRPKGFGSGNTPEEALDSFRKSFRPSPSTAARTAARIAELESEIAALKGGAK